MVKKSGKGRIGYGNPPINTRFKSGQSGNPAGRPRGSKNLITHISDTLAEKVPVREGDKVRLMTKGKAVAAQLVNGALKGEMPAIRKVVELSPAIDEQKSAASSDLNEDLTPPELDMLEAYFKRRNMPE